MSAPIVFISHLRLTGGDVDAYTRLAEPWVPRIHSEKPQTAAFLHYLDRGHGRVTIVHLFADAEAMDRHFEGADERSKEAWQAMAPEGWEIYGPAGPAAVAAMRRQAEAAGVPLQMNAEYVAGFSRLATG